MTLYILQVVRGRILGAFTSRALAEKRAGNFPGYKTRIKEFKLDA